MATTSTTFNLNDIQTFLTYIESLNSTANAVVGVDLMYFRAVPHENGESVIFHEYTLLDVECGKTIKGVVKNTEYTNGIQIDLFGVKYDSPLQIQFDLATWRSVFGNKVMPQKDDIVYVPILNRLFEVNSSSPIYTFMNQQTAWQIDMIKYNPKASRAENETLSNAIEELTDSEAGLFGDELSKQFADATDSKETSAFISTSKDPYKKVVVESALVKEDVYADSMLISNGYYNAAVDTSLHIVDYEGASDSFEQASSRPVRYFSCWFRLHSADRDTKQDVKDLSLYLKLRGESQFKLKTFGTYSIGDSITLSKGSILHITGQIIEKYGTGHEYLVSIPSREVLLASKKISNWQSIAGLKIDKTDGGGAASFLCGDNLSMKYSGDSLVVKVGGTQRSAKITKKIAKDSWYGLCFNIGPTSAGRIFSSDKKAVVSFKLGSFAEDTSIGSFWLSKGANDITDIRFYELPSEIEDEQKMQEELFSTFTINNNNAIVSDKAEIDNSLQYVGKVR